MSFFDGVRECNQANGGAHNWGGPQEVRSQLFPQLGVDYTVECGGCHVKAWGKTPAEAMGAAQDFDRANRRGRLW